MGFKVLIVLVGLVLLSSCLHTHSHLNSTCSSPGKFNSSTGQCDCKNGSVPEDGQCVCPAEKPWLHSGTCYPCNFPKVWDPKTHKCYTCPDGYKYNLTTNLCNKIHCTGGQVYKPLHQKCACPDESPYWYNDTCHKCAENAYEKEGQCQ